METKGDSKWLKTLDDGVLLFQNIKPDVKEFEKSDKKKDNEETYEQLLENSKIDEKFQTGKRFFHSELKAFCTISERVTDEEGALKEVLINIPSQNAQITLPFDENLDGTLLNTLCVTVRVLNANGSRSTISSPYFLSNSMKENMDEILSGASFKPVDFKIFYKDKLVDKNEDIAKLYEQDQDMYFMAIESGVSLKKWMRFPKVYQDSTWSSYSYYSHGICFIPKKPVAVTGFLTYVGKYETEFELKYKLVIDGDLKEEDPVKTYKDYEDTYYKTIMFHDTYDVDENARVDITIWLAKSITNCDSIETYYGTEGDNYASAPNEEMGMFTVEYGQSNESSNGVSSGQIPAILYYS